MILLGHKRADLLARALESFSQYCRADVEIVLVLNGATESVRKLALAWMEKSKLPMLVLEAAPLRPGAARNEGVRASRASLLLFLDDDIECFQDIASAAIKHLEKPSTVEAVGGANLTPPLSHALERATGYVMASRFGAASMRRRYRLQTEGPATEHDLILCNLAIRREVFLRLNGFHTHLVSNEENVILQSLEQEGARLWTSPAMAVYHRRRGTWRELTRQAVKYGMGRAQNIIMAPQTYRALYLLPSLFLLYVIGLPGLYVSFGANVFWPLHIYIFCLFANALSITASSRDIAAALTIGVCPAVHAAYGLGFLQGSLGWVFRQRDLSKPEASLL